MKDEGKKERIEQSIKKKALIRFRRMRITVNVSGHWVESNFWFRVVFKLLLLT